jgi:hypothetical protein
MKDFLKKFSASLYAAQFIPLVKDPGNRYLQSAYQADSLSEFLQAAFDISIVFAAILAVLRITWGGFLYMTSDIADNKNKAKSIIWNALLGLLLILSIYIILLQINPNILNLDIDLNEVQAVPAGQDPGSSFSQQPIGTGAGINTNTGVFGGGGEDTVPDAPN